MSKLLIDLEARVPDEEDFIDVNTVVRETRNEQATRVVNEWLAEHNIDATYTHKHESPFINVIDTKSIVFANQKEEFKYHLAGGDNAIQARYGQCMTSVILPLIRKMLPNIMATQICGVQPMSAPTAQVFKLRSRYK